MFTTLNILCGTTAVILSVNRLFEPSAWFIIVAVLCDGMDGKLARWTGCESEFGMHLDSLGDLISSGIAPMVLIYSGFFRSADWTVSWICLLYVFAGAFRLARFNLIQKGDRSHGYIGLPIPVAGMTIASLFLTGEITSWFRHMQFLAFVIILGLSLLMMSTVPYDWPKLEWGRPVKIVGSAGKLILAGLIIVFTKYTLFPVLFLYIIAGTLRWGFLLIKEKLAVDF